MGVHACEISNQIYSKDTGITPSSQQQDEMEQLVCLWWSPEEITQKCRLDSLQRHARKSINDCLYVRYGLIVSGVNLDILS